jgi:hypothetical protein
MSRFLLIPAMRRARIAPFNGSRLNSTLGFNETLTRVPVSIIIDSLNHCIIESLKKTIVNDSINQSSISSLRRPSQVPGIFGIREFVNVKTVSVR